MNKYLKTNMMLEIPHIRNTEIFHEFSYKFASIVFSTNCDSSKTTAKRLKNNQNSYFTQKFDVYVYGIKF